MTDWGSVPDWIGAAGTLLGTLVIGGGLLYEVHQRRLADARAEADRRDAQAASARLVTVSGMFYSDRVILTIRNDSDGPIRNLNYRMLLVIEGQTRTATVSRIIGDAVSYVGAHDELQVDCVFGEIESRVPAEDQDAEVEFTDAHGLRWVIRVSDDSLRRVHTPT